MKSARSEGVQKVVEFTQELITKQNENPILWQTAVLEAVRLGETACRQVCEIALPFGWAKRILRKEFVIRLDRAKDDMETFAMIWQVLPILGMPEDIQSAMAWLNAYSHPDLRDTVVMTA